MKNYCVILAGGAGLRLWPSSKQEKPKQFIDIFGKGKTLLQSTYQRLLNVVDEEHIIVSTNLQYEDIVKQQLPQLKTSNLLLEPMRRNTLPSATWATMEIMQRCEDANVMVVPSDQLIENNHEFEENVMLAFDYVDKNEKILALGVVPNRPATSFGYIQMGEPVDNDLYQIRTFLEKPQRDFAVILMENREFLWNTGIFLWKAKFFFQYIQQHWTLFNNIVDKTDLQKVEVNGGFENVKDAFAMCPNKSIEQVCLETHDATDVMLCHFDWSDVGSWQSLFNLLPKADNDNVVLSNNTFLYECKDCLVKMPKDKVVVVQGLDDYLIVEENNTLVICKKHDEKAMRMFVNDIQMNVGDNFV